MVHLAGSWGKLLIFDYLLHVIWFLCVAIKNHHTVYGDMYRLGTVEEVKYG